MGANSSEFELNTDKNGAIYVNIQGLFTKTKSNKVCYLRDLAKESNSPFIVVTETWLTEQILDAEISIQNYILYRSDRANGRSHGGSCVYVRSNLTSRMLLSHSNGTCDSLVVKVKDFETLLICIYRPPDANLEQFKESLENVQTTIDDVMENDHKCKTILQFGDYNFPFIKWPSGTIYEHNMQEDRKAEVKVQAELFLEYCQHNFLIQYCLTPTRGKNILDLILSNNQSIINNYTTIVNKKFSDHFLLKVWLNFSFNQEVKATQRKYPYTTTLYQYDLENADDEDWLRYDDMLGTVDFEEEVKIMNTNQRLRRFYEILEGTAKEIFKKKREFDDESETQKKNKPNNFIPKKVRQLMKRKSKLSSKILSSNKWWKVLEMEEELETIESELDEEYRTKKTKDESIAIKKIKKDPKYFYNYAKKSSKSPNQIGPFLEKDGTIVADSFEKAEKLRKQYKSVYSNPDERWRIQDPNGFFGVPQQEQGDPEQEHENLEHEQEHLEQEQQPGACQDCSREIVHECQEDRDQVSPNDETSDPNQSESGNQDRCTLHIGEDGLNENRSQDRCTPGSQDQCTQHIVEEGQNENGQKLEGAFFDIMDVTLAIDEIPSGACPGPDGVPPCLLKKSKMNIARMLILIYKSSFETGEIPDILKLALVSPIHKGGSRADPAQYRPISLTSHIIKVLERMLRKDMIGYLEYNDKMDNNQHGSRGKRSCVSQLLEHHLEILEMLERGENVDLIYLDLAKAFDKCGIDLLLHKVKALGITDKVGRWIHSILTGRKQHIVVNGIKFKKLKVVSEVSQGTVPPLLFLIYIADIGKMWRHS